LYLKINILISLQAQSKHDKCVYLSLYSQVDFTKDKFHELVKNKQPTFTEDEACPCQFGDKVLKIKNSIQYTLYTLHNKKLMLLFDLFEFHI